MTINYTKIDQQEVREELILQLKKTPSFKNANYSGTALYDLANVLSYNAALFGFYLNNIANEPFLNTSRQYKNINRIANSLLYNPVGKGSARVAVASKLSKDYVLKNTEGFIEIPTYSQFPSSRVTTEGDNFSFVNTKPLVVQVQQFGVSIIKDTDIRYIGEIEGGFSLNDQKVVIEGQSKRPVQYVDGNGDVHVIKTIMRSIAHDSLATFEIDTEYSMTVHKISGEYRLVIKPKTTVREDEEVFRFKVNDNRSITITQNYSSNKLYMGLLGFRNLIYTHINAVSQPGNLSNVGRLQFVIPRGVPAFEILYNGEIYSFTDTLNDIVISSDDIESEMFSDITDINIILELTDLTAKNYGAKLVLKKSEDLLVDDIVIATIDTAQIVGGNIVINQNNFITGETKSGKVTFQEGDVVKRVVFENPFDFGLLTQEIPTSSNKNYSIF